MGEKILGSSCFVNKLSNKTLFPGGTIPGTSLCTTLQGSTESAVSLSGAVQVQRLQLSHSV